MVAKGSRETEGEGASEQEGEREREIKNGVVWK